MPGKPKTDLRYWLEGKRLFKDRSPDYSVRITSSNRRIRFPLKTPNKKEAARKAAEIYGHLLLHGWSETVRVYKVGTPLGTTVGDVIRVARQFSAVRPQTFDTYTKAFRKIVTEIEDLPAQGKHDSASGGNGEWRKTVDAIPIDRVTPERVARWKSQRTGGVEPHKRGRAIVTVNSLIRNAKALFAKRHVGFMRSAVELPEQLPFDGVQLDKAPSPRYHSKIDAASLIREAHAELKPSDPEAFKVFLLALICGLRKSEIDNLLWRSFDFKRRLLRIEDSSYHQLKSEDSAGEIDLDEETASFFEDCENEHGSEFVIDSSRRPACDRKSRDYRCQRVFARLNKWLRDHGVEEDKPTHTLRKEIGSIIASQYGIFGASRYLRHSDISITAAVYADKKQRVIPEI
jgi:integrase